MIMESEKDICTICLDIFTIDKPKETLLCNHYFHKQCIILWLLHDPSCPICKTVQLINIKLEKKNEEYINNIFLLIKNIFILVNINIFELISNLDHSIFYNNISIFYNIIRKITYYILFILNEIIILFLLFNKIDNFIFNILIFIYSYIQLVILYCNILLIIFSNITVSNYIYIYLLLCVIKNIILLTKINYNI